MVKLGTLRVRTAVLEHFVERNHVDDKEMGTMLITPFPSWWGVGAMQIDPCCSGGARGTAGRMLTVQ